MDSLKPAILIMTKVPKPGLVKTRLRPILSDTQCAELAECFLVDTVSKALTVTPKVIVAYSAIGDGASIFDVVPESTICIKQNGNDLGERLVTAIDFAEANGCSPIVIVGTDSPTIPAELLCSSLQHFDDPTTELVLGGTEDGGYYLIGLRKNIPTVFQSIPWSSDKVYSTTLERANQIRLTGIVELPKWYDVDTPQDLKVLHQEFLENEDFKTVARKTAGWLKTNGYLFSQFG